MAEYDYDVVIVGAGITGALMANELGNAGYRVLILEAGKHPFDRQEAIDKFYAAENKDPGAPWPDSPYAPKANSPTNDWHNTQDNYLVQTGSVAFGSSYERSPGGTTLHWLGTALRMVPDSFSMKSTYGVLRDWPLSYTDLEPYYTEVEKQIGVAGDLAQDRYLGVPHTGRYPMGPVPQSYLDGVVGKALDGFVVDVNGVQTTLQHFSTPQARNTAGYNERPPCMGNSSCVPICPIAAKYDASVHLKLAVAASTPAVIQERSVVYKVDIDPDTDQVSRLHYKRWSYDGSVVEQSVTARRYVLAAHAIETPKILLMSPWKTLPDGTQVMAANSSGQVGKNLMDNICNVVWGLTEEPVYPFRGPLSTSGIPSFRNTPARSQRAAYRIEIGNDGWVWPTFAPQTTVQDLLDGTGRLGYGKGLWGKELSQAVQDVVTRQLRFALEMEAVPLQSSYVKPSTLLDPKTGIPRPEVHYEIYDRSEPDGTYCVDGYAETVEVANQMFQKLGAKQFTTVAKDPGTPGWFEYKGTPYQFRGAGHIFGTYRMGAEKSDSVVDRNQRSWDHENLFLVGCGVFPTTGTANPTLTASALALVAAKSISADLKQGGAC